MNPLKIIGTIFFSIGIVLLAVAFIFLLTTRNFVAQSVKTDGTVVDFNLKRSSSSGTGRSRRTSSNSYYPVVEFCTAKEEKIRFYSKIGSNPPAYKKGEKIKIRYIPGNPRKAEIDSFITLYFFALLFGILGAVFAVLGSVLLIIVIAGIKKINWLKQNGTEIKTDFLRCEIDKFYRKNGQHPFRIFTQWEDSATKTVYTFKSSPIWFDPNNYIPEDNIKVLIDLNNPKKYFMDISFLPDSG